MKHRFFLKLLASFLAAGVFPAVLLSLAIQLVLLGQVRTNLETEAQTAAAELVRGLEAELDQARGLVQRTTELAPIVALLERAPDAQDLALVSRELARLRRDVEGLEVHVVSRDQKFYATSGNLPEVYRADRYGAWGLLGRARTTEGTVYYPSRAEGPSGAPAAVSAGRFLQGEGNALWVLVDLGRERLYHRSGMSGQTLFQDLLLVDRQGTIVLDLKAPSREDLDVGLRPPEALVMGTDSRGLVLRLPVAGGEFGLEASVPFDQLVLMTRFLQGGVVLVATLSLLVSLALAWILSRSVSRPVSELVDSLGRVQAGDFSVRLNTRRHDELGEAFHGFNAMVDRLVELMTQIREEQRLLRISEGKALQAQINPHFLYNTLNSIKALASEGRTEDIRTVVVDLGRLLRSSINNRDETESVEACLRLLEGYFAIENLRFGGRFTFVVDVDEALGPLPIPKFLLQPIVENALIHGLEARRGRGTVVLTGRCGATVVFTVEDDGVGMAPEVLHQVRQALAGRDDGVHVGLVNVHRRLGLTYGPEAGLEVESSPGRTRVTLRWPLGAPC